MSTLRVDNIKSRTGTTVTIPDSQSLAVTGGLTVSGSQSFGAGATLDYKVKTSTLVLEEMFFTMMQMDRLQN